MGIFVDGKLEAKYARYSTFKAIEDFIASSKGKQLLTEVFKAIKISAAHGEGGLQFDFTKVVVGGCSPSMIASAIAFELVESDYKVNFEVLGAGHRKRYIVNIFWGFDTPKMEDFFDGFKNDKGVQ